MEVIVSTALTTFRSSAQALLSSSPESLSLVFWGCGLLAVGAGVRALNAHSLRPNHDSSAADVPYDRSLTESRA